jgi:transposase
MVVKKTYSTAQVASEIGVSKKTLFRWLYSGRLAEPKKQTFAGVESRVWSETDMIRAKVFKAEHYGKRKRS